ncbi:uncharacterized protein LOC114361672 [Ostrinia furnacalis]|uniref:uncharacterized protein LOC114361672 n=1 Tax=Ostrinia furnacalis TaxID=93504 RepID=UPI00103C23E8|nr:uncharacterized protein LOC114361672 [Ostrinia furnacalis]
MLLFKLSLVILLCEDVFGYWNPNRISILTAPNKTKKPWKKTTIQPTTEENITSGKTTPTEENTSPEIISTTEALPPSTESPAVCTTSLHSKDDLLLIINFLEKDKKIYDNIITSFRSEAENVRDKHLGELEAFHKWFQNRPMHLKHILNEIKKTRQELLPLVENISESLKQYPELRDTFEESQASVAKVFNNLERQKQICKLLCENEELHDRQMILKEDIFYDKNEFYCGSIAEVHHEIQSKLLNFSADQQQALKAKLDHDDVQYDNKLEELKKTLKNVALNEFGFTMYDILNLQDSYYHFSNEIHNASVKETLDGIKQNIAIIKPEMLALEMSVQKLAKHCTSCSNSLNFVSRQSLHSKEQQTKDEPSPKNNNILHEVLAAKLQSLEDNIKDNYTSIFDVLDQKIKEANSTNVYIDDIKQVQAEVVAATKAEHDELAKLKLTIPTQNRTNLLRLDKEVKDLLEKIKADIHFVEEYHN